MQLNYTYDETGNIIAILDAKGNLTTYTYDKARVGQWGRSFFVTLLNYNVA